MNRFLAVCVLLFALLPVGASAGSRGVSIAFVDVTKGERTKEGLRLAELLEADIRKLYGSETRSEVLPWSESDVSLTVLKKSAFASPFDRLLNGAKAKEIRSNLQRSEAWDGLVVYAYDRAHGYARLKLFDSNGEECLLIRLPLEGKGSAMKHSVLRHTRHGALIAIGSAVRWSP